MKFNPKGVRWKLRIYFSKWYQNTINIIMFTTIKRATKIASLHIYVLRSIYNIVSVCRLVKCVEVDCVVFFIYLHHDRFLKVMLSVRFSSYPKMHNSVLFYGLNDYYMIEPHSSNPYSLLNLIELSYSGRWLSQSSQT